MSDALSSAVTGTELPEVVSPDGVEPAGAEDDPTTEIESPAKIIRIGAMVKQLLEEVRNTSIDDATREQLRRIYGNSVEELKSALSPELGAELDSLSFDFTGDEPPTESELRMAQAQLVGWLEGLFHGIQATLFAQQIAARQQFEQLRQLPPGSTMGGGQGGQSDPGERPGTYL